MHSFVLNVKEKIAQYGAESLVQNPFSAKRH